MAQAVLRIRTFAGEEPVVLLDKGKFVPLGAMPAKAAWAHFDLLQSQQSIGRVRGELVQRIDVTEQTIEIRIGIPFFPTAIDENGKRLELYFTLTSTDPNHWSITWWRDPADVTNTLLPNFFRLTDYGWGAQPVNYKKLDIKGDIGAFADAVLNQSKFPRTVEHHLLNDPLANSELRRAVIAQWHLPTGVTQEELTVLRGNIGVFQQSPSVPELLLAVTTWNSGNTSGQWLTLRDLEKWSLKKTKGDDDHDEEPDCYYLMYFPLGPDPARSTEWRAAWRVLVQIPPWKALRTSGTEVKGWAEFSGKRRQPSRMILDVWNAAVNAMRTGRLLHAGRPLFALPTIECEDAAIHSVVPAFEFESAVDPRKGHVGDRVALDWTPPALRRIFFQETPDAKPKFKLSFDFRDSSEPLEIDATLKDAKDAWIPEIQNGLALSTQQIGYYFKQMRDADQRGDIVAEFNFKLGLITKRPQTEWLRFGALEFLFPKKGGSIEGQATCRLRGTWTPEKCNLVPEVLYTLRCDVRFAPTDDPAESEITSRFDVLDSAEDALQRETSAVIADRAAQAESEDFTSVDLDVRMVLRPEQNPLLRLTIRHRAGAPEAATRRFYFSAKPFFVAMLDPAAIDPEAGDVLAQWQSDDADGAQWRFGAREVGFWFPPQAVGEEMERGSRFWEGKAPDITTDGPIKYRFSRPTRMVVLPSRVPRRYIPLASNLREILRRAEVKSFTTEMVYPLELEFKRDAQGKPEVAISEAGESFGSPVSNLPAVSDDFKGKDTRRLVASTFSGAIRRWIESQDDIKFVASPYRHVRAAQAAIRSTFAARLGVFRLFDPYREDGALRLSKGLTVTPRDTKSGAPPLINVFPKDVKGAGDPVRRDLSAEQKKVDQVARYLRSNEWATPTTGEYEDRPIRAGIFHTFEYPSEFYAVLTDPTPAGATIDTLAMSALGASGAMEAEFDEGRTTFSVHTQHGQLSRLVKTRIGRVATAYNTAKHVIIYERSTVASRQFEADQGHTADGWPILRKTEEYVDIIEHTRTFASELSAQENRAGAVAGSVFVSRRIYVDGAWGRDLGHGYEIPLWNPDADASLYPKPTYYLSGFSAEGELTRNFHDHPEDLFFYSNTQRGTGKDPNTWKAQKGVDFDDMPRVGVLSTRSAPPTDVLNGQVTQPGTGSALPNRFNFRVRPEGPINLQYGRGETPMLAKVDQIYLSRSSQSAVTDVGSLSDGRLKDLLGNPPEDGAIGRWAEGQMRKYIEDALRLPEAKLDCKAVGARLRANADDLKKKCAAKLGDVTQVDRIFGSTQAQLDSTIARFRTDMLAVVDQPRTEIRALCERWRGLVERARGLEKTAVAALRAVVTEEKAFLFGVVLKRPSLALSEASKGLAKRFADIAAALDDCAKALKNLAAVLATFGGDLTTAIERATAALRKAEGAVAAVTDARVASQVAVLANVVKVMLRIVESIKAMPEQTVKAIAAELSAAISKLCELSEALQAFATVIGDGAAELGKRYDAWVTTQAKLLSDDIDAALKAKDDALIKVLDTIVGRIDGAEGTLLASYDQARNALVTPWTVVEGNLRKSLKTLREKFQVASKEAGAACTKTLDPVFLQIDALIKDFENNCSVMQENLGKIVDQVNAWRNEVQEKLTSAVADFTQSEYGRALAEARKEFADAAATAKQVFDQGSAAIKLARVVGELPALPQLTFNVDRAEYAFEDVKKQIDTSQFAAKLRDIDAGLKELGLAVPTQKLLDQFLPDSLKNTDVTFGKIFKNFAGIDFAERLLDFKIDRDFLPEELQVTHGFDKQTRSAWVRSKVDTHFEKEQKAFEIGTFQVSIARMWLFGLSELSIAADGTRRSSGSAKFKADWSLVFGGSRLVQFREVTVDYDGANGFKFDVSPDKIELHPSIKFISDLAKQFGDKIPPNVAIERDKSGRPNGVSASFLTTIPKLPPIGTLKIGPFDIASGLGLRLESGGTFVISAHMSLGTRAKPVFIEVNKLGGGFFIVIKASYPTRGSPELSASLGLTLGSQESFDIAGVARGSYQIMFFAYIEVTTRSGSSFTVGVLIAGSARILGIASASVTLLLEVQQQSGGRVQGRGSLDVEIEICWCYTLRVHQAVTHNL